MRIQGVIAAQCFLIFTFLNFYVKANGETSEEEEFDLPSTTPTSIFEQVDVEQIIEGEDHEVDTDNKDDLCQLPPKKGICKRNERRYYYDVKEERCKTFIYSGCFGNKNNFKTCTECSRHCGGKTQCPSVRPKRPKFCYQKPKRGPCKVKLPRYYFNWKKNTCEIFFYGGCRGNKNSFYRLSECKDVCKAGNYKG